MKKNLLLIVLLIYSFIPISAQHLSFDGYSINGTIANFQKGLENSGYTVNSSLSSAFAKDRKKVFTGDHIGSPCDLYVYYGPNNNVSWVRAVYSNYSELYAEAYYEEAVKWIKMLYPGSRSVKDGSKITFYPKTKKGVQFGRVVINLTHLLDYSVFVDYYDRTYFK